MRKQQSSQGKGFAMGALFGGIVGGVTALLFAPKAGEKMRKEIASKYHVVSDNAHDLIEEMCEHTQELVGKAKEVAAEAKETASHLIKQKKRRK